MYLHLAKPEQRCISAASTINIICIYILIILTYKYTMY